MNKAVAEEDEALKSEEENASDLSAALERCLNDFSGTGSGGRGRIIKLERQPSAYRSSFNLEELTVFFESGEHLSVMFKDLSWNTLLEGGKRLKPKFIYDPRREIEVYRRLLPQDILETALFYGSEVDEEAGRYWLFLEKVPGAELYQIGEFEVWQSVARWLAKFHALFADQTEALSNDSSLLKYDELFYGEWMRRAQTFHLNDERFEAERVKKQLEWLAGKYTKVIQRLMDMPRTLIHGEFYASNVLVSGAAAAPPQALAGQEQRRRVCPVDWERSGVGPSLIDLAALTGGSWNENDRWAIAQTYYDALPESPEWFSNEEAFKNALGYCRLYLAVQWVGWFGRRNSFGAHAQDWLGEAVKLAESLGL